MNKVVRAWYFSHNLNLPWSGFTAKKTTASRFDIVDATPLHGPSAMFIGVLHSLSANDDLTSSTLHISLIGELLLVDLGSGPHELAHGWKYFTDEVVIVLISIKNLDLQGLFCLKEVRSFDCFGPVRVRIILDFFCLTDLDPLAELFLIHLAERIRLAQHVHLLQVAS